MFGDLVGAIFLFLFALFALSFLALIFLAPLAAIVYTVMDILAREDLAAGKPLWIVAVLLLPGLGIVAYWLSRPVNSKPLALQTSTPQAVLRRAA